MKNFFYFLLFVFSFSLNVKSQNNGDYRSRQSGTWATASSWEVYNSGSWSTASTGPGNNIAIEIQTGHTITNGNVSRTVTGNIITVNGVLNADQATLTIGATTTVNVHGTLIQTGNLTVNGNIFVKNNGTYKYNRTNTSGIPTMTWEDGSTCEITGTLGLTIADLPGLNQSFYHFKINANFGASFRAAGTLQNIRGNFIITNTGSSSREFQLAGTQNYTLNIGGDLIIEGGILNIGTGSSGTRTINLAGNYEQSSGTFRRSSGSATVNFTGANSEFNKTGGILTTTSINFNVKENAKLTLKTNFDIVDRPLVVEQNATLDCETNLLTGTSGTFTLNSGATLITANAEGISGSGATGSIRVTGTRTYNTGANYSYNGIVAQITGNGLPATVNNLLFNNSDSVSLTNSATVTGDLSIISGTLDIGDYTLDRENNGGSLTLGTSSILKIGGTNSLPANFANYLLDVSSSVVYNGTNQVVTPLNGSQSYGNLILSGTGNKTFGGNVVTENLTNDANANTLVSSGQNIRVKSVLTNSGDFTIQNNANLIQEVTTNNNVGNITVFRESSPLWRLDYTLWSAPVVGQNLLAFSPLTVANRFYVYNPSTNQYNTITPSTNAFQTGVGYLIRMPDNHVSNVNNNPAQIWEGEFLGVPNNGDVTLTLTNDTFNAVGNPYPSTLSASAFYTANNLTQPLYFWRKINGAAGSAYATWTTAGGATSGSNTTIPNGIIQVGQGFIVKSNSNSVLFNNTMRLGNNDNQFLRIAEAEQNRVRVAISGPNSFYQDILVNYMTGATNEFDPGIDGKYINDSDTAFYTLLNHESYVIQGRSLPFNVNDIVPLGFKTTQEGTYQISLIQKDGLFISEQQDVFLKDHELNLTHNFEEGDYSFTSGTGVFEERFEIVFQNEVLNIQQPIKNEIGVVYVQGNQIIVNVGNHELMNFKVYDLTGRVIFEQLLNNTSQSMITLFGVPKQVLLVQYEVKGFGIVTKKLIF